MAQEYRFDREWRIAAPVERVWASMADVDAYQRRWPWLREFDATLLAQGERWSGTVQPPLPYAVSFVLELVHVDDATAVHAVVDGDVGGEATIIMASGGDGATTVRLTSRLEPRRPLLRAVAAVAPAVARWGHDRVIENGVAQFAAAVASG